MRRAYHEGRGALPNQGPILLVGWTGMRGAVSLAAALAIPLETDAGTPFPGRDRILFLTFAVILSTLLLQGLTLPSIIRRLDLDDPTVGDDREESTARLAAAQAARARLDELAKEEWVHDDSVMWLSGLYDNRVTTQNKRAAGGEVRAALEERSSAHTRLRSEALDAERDAVVALRNAGEISDDAMNRVLRDLDLEYERYVAGSSS
jgi:CPA1 family monovalent cation:H+ antiporter